MKRAASALALLTLAACGSDTPTTPSRPVPSVAGHYERWDGLLVQWNRAHDGVTGSFTCQSSLTLSQAADSGVGLSALTGFLVIGGPCPPQSFDLNGTVDADGNVRFSTGGPKPPEGQCPAVQKVDYAGVVVHTGDGNNAELSARGTANINCPGPGEGPQR